MPIIWTVVFSILTYVGIGVCIYVFRREVAGLITWVEQPILRRMWIMWLIFLAILAPLAAQLGDFSVWLISVRNLIAGRLMLSWYVYLPIYAEVLAGLYLPFAFFSPTISKILLQTIIHVPALFSYAFCSAMLARLAPKQPMIAALVIAANPFVVLYVFQAENHIVMLACLLAAIWLIREKRWLWAGVAAGFGCFKLLLIPSVAVMAVILLRKYGWRAVARFGIGSALTLIPSLIYYVYDPQRLIGMISNFGAVGLNSNWIEPFHFLFWFKTRIVALEAAYIGYRIWLIVIVIGAMVFVALFWRGKINSMQALALTQAVVCIAAPETLQLEPVIGLLWLDATLRRDVNLQTAVWAVILLYTAALYPELDWAYTTPALDVMLFMWEPRGLYVAAALIVAMGLALRAGASGSEVLDRTANGADPSLIIHRNG